MTTKKKKKFTSKLAMLFVFLIAVVYTVYHVFSLFLGEELSTIVSGVTTYSDTVGGTGYIFRDETVLYSDNTGAVDYLIGDGEKVAKNQAVANVFVGGGKSARVLLQTLDRQIALLEKSTIGAEPVDLSILRKQANDTYYTLMRLINSGEAGELSSQIEKMTVVLNKINVIAGGNMSVTDTLSNLHSAREDFLSGDFCTEYSGEGGYFYYSPDGYERFFSVEALDTMDSNYFYRLEEYFRKNSVTLDANVYGKIAHNTSWYFVIALPEKEAQRLQVGNEYRLNFTENNATELFMTLDRTIEAPENKETICVFYCNKLPNDFELSRAQDVKIDISEVSGIYVPRSALTRVDGVRGVFVLRGSVVRFRSVEIIYNGFDYCLVSTDFEGAGDFVPLSTNELIITNGKNLFDGRIMQ